MSPTLSKCIYIYIYLSQKIYIFYNANEKNNQTNSIKKNLKKNGYYNIIIYYTR